LRARAASAIPKLDGASNNDMGRADRDPTKKWHDFAPGQEPMVLTSISDECLEDRCEKCPGIFEREDYPSQAVFCKHDCHLAANVRQEEKFYEIDRAAFSHRMESYINRHFKIDVMDIDGKSMIHVVIAELIAFNGQTLSAEFLCDETKFSLNLDSADRLTSGPAKGFEAWLRAIGVRNCGLRYCCTEISK
jgi:hypothetical protein